MGNVAMFFLFVILEFTLITLMLRGNAPEHFRRRRMYSVMIGFVLGPALIWWLSPARGFGQNNFQPLAWVMIVNAISLAAWRALEVLERRQFKRGSTPTS